MLKACSYCGRIHARGYDCGRKPFLKRHTKQDALRSTSAWQRRRGAVRERDHNLCRWCLAKDVLVWADLSVHHIEPLEERPDLALEDDNLITLCGACHELAERGEIARAELHRLARIPPALPERFTPNAPHRLSPTGEERFPK